ncbi:Uncharacterised protein [Escherichia coli]|nr:Uncharacterised protein [Escherichia coli]VWM80203.1 Uncharacterised protein [Escherichia coli]
MVQPFRPPGITFFCIFDTLVPTNYLVDTTLPNTPDYDQMGLTGRLLFQAGWNNNRLIS